MWFEDQLEEESELWKEDFSFISACFIFLLVLLTGLGIFLALFFGE